MEFLFRVIPHKTGIDAMFEFVNRQRLVSTWVYAVFFYLFWRMDDTQTVLRRSDCCRLSLHSDSDINHPCCPSLDQLAVAWAQPDFSFALSKVFLGNGNADSFSQPFHADLSLVAMGFWPLSGASV